MPARNLMGSSHLGFNRYASNRQELEIRPQSLKHEETHPALPFRSIDSMGEARLEYLHTHPAFARQLFQQRAQENNAAHSFVRRGLDTIVQLELSLWLG